MRQSFKLIILLSILMSQANSKTIYDMTEKEVYIPQKVEKTFSASPPMMALLYTLAPKTMIGVNYSFLAVEKQFMLPYVQKLPVLGGFFGGGKHANLENVLVLKPDIVFAWDISRAASQHFEETLTSFSIPVVYIRQNTLYDTLDAIEVMAQSLGVEKRGDELIAYGKKSLQRVQKSVSSLKTDKKVRVYFAQDVDGLATECSNNRQSDVITFAGGINVHKCPDTKKGKYKREKISIEELYNYNPDVILVREKSFFDSLANNKRWHNLNAYKNKKVFLVPSSPFPWLNRPPSFMRLLGVQWLHHILYPKHFPFDTYKETTYFYEKFLHVRLTNNDINQLFQGGIK